MNNQFIDVSWLQVFGLTIENALDYFYTSPFYDNVNSNNEIIRSQQANIAHLNSMTGIEYVVNIKYSKPPHLFIIMKQHRSSSTSIEVLEAFYILDGIIYQAPNLSHLIISRMDKVSLHASKSFQNLHQILKLQDNNVTTGADSSNYLLSEQYKCLDYSIQINDIASKNFFGNSVTY